MAFEINDFDEGKSISRAIGRGGPKWHSLRSLLFQGPQKIKIFNRNYI
jgi:hypothetical protein